MSSFATYATTAATTAATSYTPVFLSIGINAFRGIAAIRLALEGYRIAFRAQSVNGLADVLISICIAYASLTFYVAPFPGVGKSLTKIVTDAGLDLAETIDTQTEHNIGEALSSAVGAADGTSWDIITNPVGVGRYFILETALSVMQAALLGVTAFGFIATGIAIMVGPIFIPFMLLPPLEWLATGWFRCFIQYSFYPVVSGAFVFIYGQIWLNYSSVFSGPMDSQRIAAAVAVVITFGFAGVYGVLKVPTFVSHLFSGSSGAGTL